MSEPHEVSATPLPMSDNKGRTWARRVLATQRADVCCTSPGDLYKLAAGSVDTGGCGRALCVVARRGHQHKPFLRESSLQLARYELQ